MTNLSHQEGKKVVHDTYPINGVDPLTAVNFQDPHSWKQCYTSPK